MGQTDSKYVINDFNLVKIPKNNKIIKISSYYVDIKHTTNLNIKIDDILTYFKSSYKNKDIDILCVQGIKDYTSAYTLVRAITKYCFVKGIHVYLAPAFEEITVDGKYSSAESLSKISKVSENRASVSGTSSFRKKNAKNTECQNIIISKFPIVSFIYTELDDNIEIDDIIGTKNVIGANILVEGTIISIYNTELTKDIKMSNVINDDVRAVELEVIFRLIDENKKELKTSEFSRFNIPDIHILIGTFNIPEIIDGNINDEYNTLIQNMYCIDIYRHLNDGKDIHDIPGYTNTQNERTGYIFFLLTKDVYTDGTKLNKKFTNITTNKQLFETLFKRYCVFFLDYCVRSDVNIRNLSMNYPIECSFMLKYKN